MRMSSNKEEPGKRKQKKTKTMSVNTSVYCSDTRLVRNTERRDVERRRKQSELEKRGMQRRRIKGEGGERKKEL